MSDSKQPVLEVRNLSVALPKGGDRVHAVEKVSFTVNPGEIVCLVGESGSGKSVIAFTVMGLLAKALKPTSGEILLQGENILAASEARLRELRCTRMSMIFQEPMTALNPVMTCGMQIDEVLNTHTQLDAAARKAKIIAILARVKLPEPERIYASYPHQLSGGQRQRIMIAMARPGAADRRRAHDRARRHDPGRDPEADRRIAGGSGHRRAVHHPRFRRRGRDRPPRGRAALGRAGRDGAD
jgi:peptide/nickel transport system ATP-binding protein